MLQPTKLKGYIESEMRQTFPSGPDELQDVEKFAEVIAKAVVTYINNHVLVPVLPVATVGGPTAQAGATIPTKGIGTPLIESN